MDNITMEPTVPLPIPPRAPPHADAGNLVWLRKNLFAGWKNTVATLLILAVLLALLPAFIDWAVLKAVWSPDNAACRALAQHGACWGVIAEKYRVILFGRYPFEQQWRPMVATVLLVSMVVASCTRWLWSRWLVLVWVVMLAAVFLLMGGGVAGLSRVGTANWGGLPLTVMLSTFSIGLAFPLAILLALGRLSKLPAIRSLCTVYIELIRGVPLISVLFMASFMFPLFMPRGFSIDVLVRVLAGISLFTAAYLAEVVRAGIQAVPRGQLEAAATIGLNYWQTQRKIVLPQALRQVVPSIMNSFISTFKDTSLVIIVSLYELTGGLTLAIAGDAQWRQFYLEGYLFIAAIYWVFCYAMSRYSRWVEAYLNRGNRRL
ncbi:MAG: amino acid ABC transporter permease [Janthinobacterium lividum]